MDRSEFVEPVREEKRTELSRLGSSKALYAATAGEMDAEEVLRATADAEWAARETFEAWAEAAGDPRAGEAFGSIAEATHDRYRTVVDEMDADHDATDEPPALHRYLRDLEGDVERAGGFVGYALARDATVGQVVGFFVGNADPRTASTFRGLREDLDDQLDRGLDLLEAICESEEDIERARRSAIDAVAAAYEEYVDSLEAMGVNPKPVC